jgi:hypothetical protein
MLQNAEDKFVFLIPIGHAPSVSKINVNRVSLSKKGAQAKEVLKEKWGETRFLLFVWLSL